MTCPRCHQETSRLIIDRHGPACAHCRGLSENGGTRIDGALSRSSDRVRAQQQTNEGDMILPHAFDKLTNKVVPNEAFIKRYPEQLDAYFSQHELEGAGYKKIGKVFAAKESEQKAAQAERDSIVFAPDPEQATMKQIVNDL